MKVTDKYMDEVLSKVQTLLWGGSETENISAHNLIAKLIQDRAGDEPSPAVTPKTKNYVFNIEQTVIVKADSLSEAEDNLPVYPSGFIGQAYYVTDESVELLKEVSV